MKHLIIILTALLAFSLNGFSFLHQLPRTVDTRFPQSLEPKPITIAAVGDIMMGTRGALPPCDGKSVFHSVKHHLSGADIVFGNLEGPLADNIPTIKCGPSRSMWCFEFVTPTRYASHLLDAGFNVVSIANNHTYDAGRKGIESTLDTLQFLGIEAAGGRAVGSVNIKGKRIAVIGFSFRFMPYSYNIKDIASASAVIQKIKKDNDIVIVSFHGGAEGKNAQHVTGRDELFLGTNRGNTMKFSHAAVDAGADLVIGHGPHVLRALEIYRGKLIAYSLGNFLTYKMFNIKGPSGISVILNIKMDPATGDFLEGKIIPIKLANGGIPEIDTHREAIGIIQQLTATDIKSQDLVIDGSGRLLRKIITNETNNLNSVSP